MEILVAFVNEQMRYGTVLVVDQMRYGTVLVMGKWGMGLSLLWT